MQVKKMSDEQRLSDRLQYVVGALISIVLLLVYLSLSDDYGKKTLVTERSSDEAVVNTRVNEEIKK